MKAQASGPLLSTVFVDYDNIYLSLKRKNEDAAKRFAKDAALWLREIETGSLITATNGMVTTAPRRIVMNRCYGNPVPRRNSSDNSTDMNSFPFVRHHFLRAGTEAIDCPPLTSQLKNSADIRMVMDVRDLISHDTYFDEFIILSGDADFTPLLHRLRAHARRTVVFANDHTAAPYTAIADGEIRESSLIALLLEGRSGATAESNAAQSATGTASTAKSLDAIRREILAEVVGWVRTAGQPVPLEALADRAVRTLGHDRTVGTGWAGAGSFSNLLGKGLPAEIRLSDQPPYYVFDASRQLAQSQPEQRQTEQRRTEPAFRDPVMPRPEPNLREPVRQEPALAPPAPNASTPRAPRIDPQLDRLAATPPATPPATPAAPAAPEATYMQTRAPQQYAATPAAAAAQRPAPRQEQPSSNIQQSITRIHDACQAPRWPRRNTAHCLK